MMCQFCGLYGCDEMCRETPLAMPTAMSDDRDDDLAFATAVLRDVLDYVRWDQMPDDLCADVDAVLDGNTEDESV